MTTWDKWAVIIIVALLSALWLSGCSRFSERSCRLDVVVRIADSPDGSSSESIKNGLANGASAGKMIWITGHEYNGEIIPDDFAVLGHEVWHKLRVDCPNLHDPDEGIRIDRYPKR